MSVDSLLTKNKSWRSKQDWKFLTSKSKSDLTHIYKLFIMPLW